MPEVCDEVDGVGDTGVEEDGSGGSLWTEADATSNDATNDDASSSVRGDVANGNK